MPMPDGKQNRCGTKGQYDKVLRMIDIVEVGPDHPLFPPLCDLRHAVLRAPLGMRFTPEELAVYEARLISPPPRTAG